MLIKAKDLKAGMVVIDRTKAFSDARLSTRAVVLQPHTYEYETADSTVYVDPESEIEVADVLVDPQQQKD